MNLATQSNCVICLNKNDSNKTQLPLVESKKVFNQLTTLLDSTIKISSFKYQSARLFCEFCFEAAIELDKLYERLNKLQQELMDLSSNIFRDVLQRRNKFNDTNDQIIETNCHNKILNCKTGLFETVENVASEKSCSEIINLERDKNCKTPTKEKINDIITDTKNKSFSHYADVTHSCNHETRQEDSTIKAEDFCKNVIVMESAVYTNPYKDDSKVDSDAKSSTTESTIVDIFFSENHPEDTEEKKISPEIVDIVVLTQTGHEKIEQQNDLFPSIFDEYCEKTINILESIEKDPLESIEKDPLESIEKDPLESIEKDPLESIEKDPLEITKDSIPSFSDDSPTEKRAEHTKSDQSGLMKTVRLPIVQLKRIALTDFQRKKTENPPVGNSSTEEKNTIKKGRLQNFRHKPVHQCLCGFFCKSIKALRNHERIHTEELLSVGSFTQPENTTPSKAVPLQTSSMPTQMSGLHKRPNNSRKCSLCGKALPCSGQEGNTGKNVYRIYKCSLCSYTEQRHKLALKRHENSHKAINVPEGENSVDTLSHKNNTKFAKMSFIPHESTLKVLSKYPKNFVCSICSKTFKDSVELMAHEKMHIAYKNVNQCPLCKQLFRTAFELINHKIQLHKTKQNMKDSISPEASPKSSNSQFRQETLLTKDKRDKTVKTSPIRKKPVNGLKINKKLNPTGPFKCSFCEKAFAQSYSLKIHEKVIHTIPFQCSICGKAFSSSKLLKMHNQIHKLARQPYTCTKCEMSFKGPEYLESHQIIHAGEISCQLNYIKSENEMAESGT